VGGANEKLIFFAYQLRVLEIRLTHNRPVMLFGNRKLYFRIFLVQYFLNLKKNHPSGNLKFNNLGIFQSLKFRILLKKIIPISLISYISLQIL